MKVPLVLVLYILCFALFAGLLAGFHGDPALAIVVLAIGVPLAYLGYRNDQEMRRNYRLIREQWDRRRKSKRGPKKGV